jgi:hypothetical protein
VGVHTHIGEKAKQGPSATSSARRIYQLSSLFIQQLASPWIHGGKRWSRACLHTPKKKNHLIKLILLIEKTLGIRSILTPIFIEHDVVCILPSVKG